MARPRTLALCLALTATICICSATSEPSSRTILSSLEKAFQSAVQYQAADTNAPKSSVKPLSKDSSSEEVIPGLKETNGAAIRESMPDLSRFGPLVDMAMPLVPITKDILNLLGIESQYWVVDRLEPKVQATILAPTAEAWAKLPIQVLLKGGLPLKKVLLLPPGLKILALAKLKAQLAKQLIGNMVLDKLVLDAQLANGTVVHTMGGDKLKVLIKRDGSKYFTANGMKVKIAKTDIGFGPIKAHFVDSFVLPKKFVWELLD